MVQVLDSVSRFGSKPLLLRRTTQNEQNDHLVIADGFTAGRIFQVVRPSGPAWLWTLAGPYCNSPSLKIATSGETETLVEAMAAFRTAFDRWLSWATTDAKPNELVWHG